MWMMAGLLLTLAAVLGEGLVFDYLYKSGRIHKGRRVIMNGVAGSLTSLVGFALAFRSLGLSNELLFGIVAGMALFLAVGMTSMMAWMYQLLKAQEEKKALEKEERVAVHGPGEQPVRWYHIAIAIAVLVLLAAAFWWRSVA